MRKHCQGMTLIELMVSMLIFTIGLLGLMGMQSRAVTNFSAANERTTAAMLADALISDIWGHRANIANYAYATGTPNSTIASWETTVQAALPNALGTVKVAGQQVTVTITWQGPDAKAAGIVHNHVVTATIENP